MNIFFNSQYSLDELEQFRDENGFIDLTKAGIQFTQETREEAGNPSRVKNWVDFQGRKALVKGEAIREEEQNYGIYAELIVEEVAKQVGQTTAHYDLVKFLGEDGKYHQGVLSVSVLENSREQLVTLHDIIGDEPEETSDFIDTTSYEFTIRKLEEELRKDGYDEQNIVNVITEYKKRLVFLLAVIETDQHTENIAFKQSKIDGRSRIELSPNYDRESAFMLDNDISTIGKLLEDYIGLRESVDRAHPRIGTIRTIEDGGFESYWKDTFEALCEEDEIYDYYEQNIRGTIDIEKAMEGVEQRIKAPLPEAVKLLVKHACRIRNEQMERIMDGEMLIEEQVDVSMLFRLIANQGVATKVRTGEQVQIGNIMQRDIVSMQKNIEDKSREDFTI
ncbi:MAG: hypothetical protein HFJ29_06895 [Clostridia bacterium]|nr:hypothetical protein [Clostridia bacterium]